MTKHKISIKDSSYGPFSMVAYEHIQELGVKYLEIAIPGNSVLYQDMLDDEDLDFQAGSFNFEIVTDDPTVIDRFKEACETCKPFEYEYFFSSVKTKGAFEENREEGYKVLHEMGEIALKYGKFISMETHPPYCHNATEMLRTMKAVDSQGVKINFDTANIYYYNDFQIGEGITEMEKVIDYIGSLHIKESNGKPKGWFFPALGEEGGIVDFKKVFDIMDKSGFNGIYTIEIEGTEAHPNKSLTMDEAKLRAQKSIDHLKKIGVF